VRIANAPARWTLCFLALPALWIAGSLATDVHAESMIPAAFVIALLSALTAFRSGRGRRGALGYLLGTGAMMFVALLIAIATIFTIYCGDPLGPDC
jgi:hypothetical protein